jgi:hypothetical protein
VASSESKQYVIGSFTSQQWSGRPAKDGCAMFVGSGVLGVVLCLVLMIIIPILREPGVALGFIVLVSAVLTVLFIRGRSSLEAAFLRNLTAETNASLRELTGHPNDHFTTETLRTFVEKSETLSLLVNGVSGVSLSPVRVTIEGEQQIRRPVRDESVQPGVKDWRTGAGSSSGKQPEPVVTTQLVLTVSSPDYGTESFDRLFSAALDVGKID